ncbi:MAG TPA: hypothetical protein VGO25_03850 [Rhodanobacteraceae bacterium]|nr:hypothetical protein [Rhodanobacteraceae bacterium]
MLSFKTSAFAAIASLISATGYAADGDLDPTFGTGGIAYISPDLTAAQELQPAATIVLPDGKILFGGSLDKPTGVPFEQEYRGMLARLNADGSVDTTFGNTTIPGIVEIPNLVAGNRMEGIESMQRLDDGSIVAVGVSEVNSPLQGFVIKVDQNGTLDPTFGSGGVVLIPQTFVHAVGIDSAGRIVAAGEQIASGVYTSTVLRFAADGTPDSAFGSGGTVSIEWDGAGNSSYLGALIMQADDGVIVAGEYDVYGDGLGSDFAIARVDAAGALDAAFGEGGTRVFHDPGNSSFVNAINRIAATSDGGIAFAGYYLNADSATALIIGHLAADGSTDATFGDIASPGYFRPAILPTAQSANASALVAQPDGKLLASVSYYPNPPDKENFYVLRSTAAGQLDTTFADSGIFATDLAPDGAYSETGTIGLQPDGLILLAGRAQRTSDFVVDLGAVRLLNGGAPTDRIFANGFEP